MITFDFFNDGETDLVEKFCRYFELNKKKVVDYFVTVNPDILTPELLVKTFELRLDNYDSNKLQIVSRHMTTASEDEVHSFLELGILDLRTMLQEDTTLSRFLLQHNIKVYVDEHEIEIKGKSYPILGSEETCVECYNGREQICTGYSKCKSFEKLNHLSVKLYFYNATVEFFINASLEQMKRYSTIDKCPEILNTLDNVLSAVNGQFSTTYNLCYDWMSQKKNCYILAFLCRLSDMKTFAPIDYRNAYQDYENLLCSCGYNYSDYMENIVPKRVYDNIFFLKKFISIYFYNSEEYGSLLPKGRILPNNIKLFQVDGENIVKISV